MIFVLSDSHAPSRASEIPAEFMEKAEKSDLTVHCGDFVEEEVFEELDNLGEFIGVKGNCDRFSLQNSAAFEREGTNFGVYHGAGINPRGHHPTLVNIAEQMDVDILLHGHTHNQEAVKTDGKILLNPGSCTGVGGSVAESGNPTAMELDVNSENLKVRMIELENGEVSIFEKFEFEI